MKNPEYPVRFRVSIDLKRRPRRQLQYDDPPLRHQPFPSRRMRNNLHSSPPSVANYLRPARAAKNTKPSLHITPDVLEESNSYLVGSNSGGLSRSLPHNPNSVSHTVTIPPSPNQQRPSCNPRPPPPSTGGLLAPQTNPHGPPTQCSDAHRGIEPASASNLSTQLPRIEISSHDTDHPTSTSAHQPTVASNHQHTPPFPSRQRTSIIPLLLHSTAAPSALPTDLHQPASQSAASSGTEPPSGTIEYSHDSDYATFIPTQRPTATLDEDHINTSRPRSHSRDSASSHVNDAPRDPSPLPVLAHCIPQSLSHDAGFRQHSPALPDSSPGPQAACFPPRPSGEIYTRFQKSIRCRKEFINWYVSQEAVSFEMPPVEPSCFSHRLDIGDLFIHRLSRDTTRVWLWSAQRMWHRLQEGDTHPYLEDYVFQMLKSGEPSWVTRKTVVTYMGRVKRQQKGVLSC